MSILKITKLSKDAKLPFYASEDAAGMDLSYCGEDIIIIKPGARALVPTSIAVALEKGYEGQIRPRSGLSAKHGITVLNSPGTIDADYRGEIKIILINLGDQDFVVENGMRIAQLVIAKYHLPKIVEVDSLDETTRGSGGFGSSGVM